MFLFYRNSNPDIKSNLQDCFEGLNYHWFLIYESESMVLNLRGLLEKTDTRTCKKIC